MPTTQLKLFETAIMQSWNSIVITDADLESGCKVQVANPAFCAMTGYSLEELRGRSLKMLQGPDTDLAVIDRLRTCLKEARFFEGMTTNYRKDGSSYIVRWNISPIHDADGVLTHFVSVQQARSEQVRAERANRLLASSLDATSDPVLLMDDQARIVFANTAFATLTGYTAEEVIGQTPAVFQADGHDDALYQAMRQSLADGKDFRATFVYRRRDGSLYHVEQSLSPMSDERGRITHYVSVGKDISARVAMEQALRHAATRDKLTGLHNRRHGEQLLAEAHRNAVAQGGSFTLIMSDIDRFKQINDRFGHIAGDRVLADVARNIRQALRSRDAVIRWGGEEFLIIIDGCSESASSELAERVRQSVSRHRDAEVGQVTLSLGLAALAPGETIEKLLARADAALYEAKRDGRNRLSVSRREHDTAESLR